MWMMDACGSALYAGITAILAKVGVQDVDAHVATALRTSVVLIFSWLIVLLTGAQQGIGELSARMLTFLVLSGLATGLSWLCYDRALSQGPASVVVPMDKLSILVTVAFARVFMGERLSRRGLTGLMLLVAGTIMMAA